VLSLSQVLDFPAETRNALLAAAILLIPLCAQLAATYLVRQIRCLRVQLDNNTRLTEAALAEIQEHNENCTDSPTERDAQEV
jgi:hypothetical protein